MISKLQLVDDEPLEHALAAKVLEDAPGSYAASFRPSRIDLLVQLGFPIETHHGGTSPRPKDRPGACGP